MGVQEQRVNVELIYCAAGNPRFARIAIDAGFRYGAQLPNKVYFRPFFCDQNWRKPDRARYMAAIAEHEPHIATVLDLERADQIDEVLSWAEEAAKNVQVVVVIPKAQGVIGHLPETVNGKEIRLGYSVPTKYGATELMPWEFWGRTVHLLGGSPSRQMELALYMDVRSADGNAAQQAAIKWGVEWRDGKWKAGKRYDVKHAYRVFADSCRNIVVGWNTLAR